MVLPISESKLCDFFTYDYRGESDVAKKIEETCTLIQGSIDLKNGPLVKIAVFETDDDKVMMFCIHHLVVDGVSWRILLEDFRTVLDQLEKGEKITLPTKTASFKEWSEALEAEGISSLGKKDNNYWEAYIKDIKSLYSNLGIPNEESVFKSITVNLEEKETEKLLYDINHVFNTQIDDILLCAVVRAMHSFDNRERVAISIEGHGREEISKPIEIDRTVGWFTNIYPILFAYYDDYETAIVSVKEAIRNVPNKGMGFGYIDNCEEYQPDIFYNYLGQVFENETDIGEYSPGISIANENHTNANITFNGSLKNNSLEFDIIFNANLIPESKIAEVGKVFKNTLVEIVDYCEAKDDSVMTLSDLDTEDFGASDLGIINDFLNGL